MSGLRGPDVIAGWGAANAVLLAVLIGYGDSWLAIGLYAGSVALTEVIAIVAWRVTRSHEVWAATSPAPRQTRAALLAALVVMFVGAGLIWQRWLMLPAIYPALALVAELVNVVPAAPAPPPAPTPPPGEKSHAVAGASAAAAVAAAAVAGRRSLTRRRAR